MLSTSIAAVRHISVVKLGESILEALGVLWLILEITAYFSTQSSAVIRPYWWLFLIGGVGAGLVRAWPRLAASEIVEGSDCTIEIRVCDILSLRHVALVVGTNDTFDTALSDGTISSESVQGQATLRLLASPEQLNRELDHSLAGTAATELSYDDKPFGNLKRYPIGTVASVDAGTRRIYFAAIASLNAHRVAHTTRRDIADALPRIWEHIRERGGLHPLACPVLGSGYSRLDATREELIREIIRSFVPAVRAGMFCRGLTIAVSPRDFRDGRVSLTALGSFLAHECKYGSAGLSRDVGGPLGTPQGSA